MISPGFFSLFNAHRGLLAAQTALNTINHNVANANTPGYTRQRVELSAPDAYAQPILGGNHNLFGQIGQGVMVDQIIRVRDAFLDGQYRLESSILGTNTSIRDGLQQLEGVIGEPSTSSVNGVLQKFFDAAQEMSLHPESIAVRANFLQQAQDVLDTFQQKATQLDDLRRNLVGDPLVPGSYATSQLAIQVNDVNTKLATIAQLNREIVTVISSGGQPNDLYDKRDLLLDELSKIVDIEVQNNPTGQIDVSIGGEKLVRGVTLLDTLQVVANPGPVPDPDDEPTLVQTVNSAVTLNSTIDSGQIRGLLDVGGNPATKTSIRGVLEDLDTLVTEIVDQINALQSTGRDLSGNIPADPIFDLAAGPTLSIFRYSLNANVLADPTRIAAAHDDPTASGPPAGFAGPNDGRNALRIAQLRDRTFAALGNSSFGDYLNGIVSKLGIDAKAFEDRSVSQKTLIHQLNQRRETVSGVNQDEEMIDMLRFQRAFEAASKMISVFDDITRTILGIVQ